ncbi:MAG: hypothetical protein WA765_13785 [Candidatus Acidiferrum sp.]
MSLSLFTLTGSGTGMGSANFRPAGTVVCPGCNGDVAPLETAAGWQTCPFCEKRLHIRLWPAIRRNTNAAVAMAEQATCFFHPDKAFQACCKRCGRFVCALCDLQLGAEHVCPTCFERGRADSGLKGDKAEWRHRDVLYDSISLTLGWSWIIFWPIIVAAFPAAIFLHAKYRKAPRSYLIPRSGWRFWMAYVGFIWLPILLTAMILLPRLVGRRP